MLFVYWGDNSYFLTRQKEKIRQEGLKEKAQLIVIDFSQDNNLTYLKQSLLSQGLFDVKKKIILSDFDKNKESLHTKEKELLIEAFKDIAKDPVNNLYLFETSIALKDSFWSRLKRGGAKIEKFNGLKPKEIEMFLAEDVKELGIKIEPFLFSKVCFSLNYQPWNIVNELKKIHAFKKGEQISKEDVDTFVRPELTNDIFKTIDALARGDKGQAISMLHRHLKSKDDPFYLLSMFIYQFRNMLKVSDALEKGFSRGEVATKTRLHPFVAGKCIEFVSRASLERLKSLYNKLAQIDYSVKRGGLDVNSALDLFIAFS